MIAVVTPHPPPSSSPTGGISTAHAQMLSPTHPQSALMPTSPPMPAAAPPTRSEIERKLSFKSAAGPKGATSPKKKRVASGGGAPGPGPSGTDSDSSLNPSSPILGPIGGSVPMIGGISAASSKAPLTSIAERERKTSGGIGSEEEIYEDEEEGGDEDGSGSEGEAGGAVGGPKAGGEEFARGMEGERVLKSGYLWKKQEKRKVWKKKWFVLRTAKLAYYKDDKEYSLSRVIDLRQVHTVAAVKVKKQSFTFGIVTLKRTFLARASSQDEMDVWVVAINTALRKLNGGDSTSAAAASTSAPTGAPAAPVPIGAPPRLDTSSGFAFSPSSTTAGSPVITTSSGGAAASGGGGGGGGGGYFAKSPSQMSGGHSPVIETLDSRLAKISLPGSSTSTSGAGGVGGGGVASQQSSLGRGIPRAVSSSARREPSASSLASSVTTQGDYFPRQPSGQPLSPVQPSILSSDEEEHDNNDQVFSDPMVALGSGAVPMTNISYPHVGGTVDPKKVILSSYLMKRSKGRGRKVWRKRWFFLTSQGLTYTKSHMDTKALRYIPLSSILDALDLPTPGGSSSDPDSEDDPRPHRTTSTSSHGHYTGNDRSPPQRQLSQLGTSLHSLGGMSHMSNLGKREKVDEEHTFRLVTAKRTYVLCAPSEEDEIKWLAAFRALLQRERAAGPSSPMTEMPPRLLPTSPGAGGAGGAGVPVITQQPPTPALSISSANTITPGGGGGGGGGGVGLGLDNDSIRSGSVRSGSAASGRSGGSGGSPTTANPPSPQAVFGSRGRSATYTAKSAVADVVRRFHPEQHQQGQAA